MMRPHAPLGSESDTESDYDDLPGLVSQSDSSDSDSDDELQLEREDPEPELELEDPEPELELEDPEPELELEEPEPDLSLAERMRGGTDEPAVGTTPQRAADSRGSAYGLTSGRFTVHSSSDGDAARPSLLTYHEEDAHLFLEQFADLVGAPLKRVFTYVLDADKKREGRVAHITVTPPPDRFARIDATRQTRRPNDRKRLNAAGQVALLRERASGTKGDLWKMSKVWIMEYRCSGTWLCDVLAVQKHGCNCAVRVLFSATVEQVSKQLVQIQVMGCDLGGAAGSLHSKLSSWDPELLRRRTAREAPAWRAAVKIQASAVDKLRQQIISQQRQDEGEHDPGVDQELQRCGCMRDQG